MHIDLVHAVVACHPWGALSSVVASAPANLRQRANSERLNPTRCMQQRVEATIRGLRSRLCGSSNGASAEPERSNTSGKPDPKPVKVSVNQQLKTAQSAVLNLHAHLSALKKFQNALGQATGGKPFLIRDAFVWSVMLHSRDAFVIHFASWARSVYEDGGLLGQIGADCSRLYIKKPKSKSTDDYGEVQYSIHRREAFERLFPDAAARAKGKVRHEEVVKLRDRFVTDVAAVVTDRNEHRAHPYEKQETATAAMMDLTQLDDALSACKTFIHDLSLVLNDLTTSYPDNLLGSNRTAESLVDLMLFFRDPGELLYDVEQLVHAQTGNYAWQRRKEAYEAIRAHQEARELEAEALTPFQKAACGGKDTHYLNDDLPGIRELLKGREIR
jgi:hypothetical protein